MVSGVPTIVFRADAGLHIGSGHVMRCLSLAAELRALGGRVHFVCRAHDGHLGALIEAQGNALHLLPTGAPSPGNWLGTDWASDAEQTLQAIAGLRPDWLVVDHYALDTRWEQRVGAVAGQCLVIDDLADRPHCADVLLDQNLQPAPRRYDPLLPSGSRKLLGPRFALLREEFARLRGLQRQKPTKRLDRVLAFAGANDPTDLLGKVAQAWRRLDAGQRPQLVLVVGQHSVNLAGLRALAEAEPECDLHVQTSEMATLIDSADLMITAGGSVNWERCCLGVPALVCETAANQHDNVRELARSRTAISLGRAEALSIDELAGWLRRLAGRHILLKGLGRRAARLVDGQGARRVAVAMLAQRLVLRRAALEDSGPVWLWRNAESTRRYFTDPASISLASHRAWWSAALNDDSRILLIAQIAAEPVGVLRFDVDRDEALVSIYLDPELTGLQLGVHLLNSGRAWMTDEHPHVRRLNATIHPSNRSSLAVFAAAGYAPSGNQWLLEIQPVSC